MILTQKFIAFKVQSFLFIFLYCCVFVLFFHQDNPFLKLIVVLIAFIALVLRAYERTFIQKEIFFVLVLLLLLETMGFSYFYNENYIRFLGELNTFILYCYIVLVVKKYSLSPKIHYSIVVTLSGFSLVPVVLYLFGFFPIDPLKGFGGFGEHRNHYAIITGFFCLVIILYYQSKLRYMVLPFLLFGLWLSGSRGSWLSLFCAFWLYLNLRTKWNLKKIIYNVLMLLIGYLFYELYMAYKYGVEPHGDVNRIYILQLFFDSIGNNIFFGVGKNLYFEMDMFNSSVYAHNFLIQIWANYGSITLIVYLFFLYYIFKLLTIKGKTLLIYILMAGLFQPLFDIRFNPFYLLTFCILMYYENYNRYTKEYYA